MRKNNFRSLYVEELQKINREIVPLFGIRSSVGCGSYAIVNGRKTQVNIVVGETNTYKSINALESIGQKVKKIMGVNEVYSFGIKLA